MKKRVIIAGIIVDSNELQQKIDGAQPITVFKQTIDQML